MGLILAIVVHSADIQDRDGAKLVLKEMQYKYPLLKKILADGGYGVSFFGGLQIDAFFG
jgi:putative transposase